MLKDTGRPEKKDRWGTDIQIERLLYYVQIDQQC